MKIVIDANKFMTVLECAKVLKAEYIVIPRILIQKSPLYSILGVSYESIITSSYFSQLDNETYYTLWDYPELNYIVLESKDINNFIQMHKALCSDKQGNVYPIESIEVFTNDYMVNYTKVSIGYWLREATGKKNCPNIPLYPYEHLLSKANTLYFHRNRSIQILPEIDITNDERFMSIVMSKVREGASIWIPKIETVPSEYAMTLMGSLLNISKGDSIYCTIEEPIEYRGGNSFIVSFRIVKHKKKCILLYNMMMLKVGM